jgi:hypothetical protein
MFPLWDASCVGRNCSMQSDHRCGSNLKLSVFARTMGSPWEGLQPLLKMKNARSRICGHRAVFVRHQARHDFQFGIAAKDGGNLNGTPKYFWMFRVQR